MFSKLMALFSGKNPTPNTYIQVKDLDSEVTLFYKGKVLTPNTDYTVVVKQDRNFTIKIFQQLEKEHLDVRRCFTPYLFRGEKPRVIQRPWGFKKFKVV